MEVPLTLLLSRAQLGDRFAENLAARLVVDKLRTMARALLGRERKGHTLQATALVSEVFIQKLRRLETPILSREHYYSMAAYAMRQVLIDHARARSAQKRVPPDAVADLLMTSGNSSMDADTRLAVQQAFERLAALDAKAAAAIRCRFIDGYTVQQAAERLNSPRWKVRADCEFGLKWMADGLRGLS